MIRELIESDADEYCLLRRKALVESPLAFAASPADDFASSVESVREQLQRGPKSVIFGAFQPHLVGTAGLYRDRHVKASHKVHLWGMYVSPDYRRQGIAANLLQAVLAHARTLPGVSWVHLSVSSAAPEARRLYERFGFFPWGLEPDALRHGQTAVAEYHMAVYLPTSAPDASGRVDQAAKSPANE